MPEPIISNVSDTARWVAAYRAWESARPDALFRDPFAERLAGEHGKAIVAQTSRDRSVANGWPMITRTRVIDDLILASVAGGCDTVLNLAAGLDTRPYRLPLPRSLRWIEADLPRILDEKEAILAREEPACQLVRERVDLADAPARAALFDRVAAGAKRALVLTEGLVVYLPDDVVRALGRDLAARAPFRDWIVDLSSPAILRRMQRSMATQLVNAPMVFAPAEGIAFFEALGWRAGELRSLFHEGVRLRRVPWFMRPFALLPRPDPRELGDKPWSAVVRFERPGP